MGHHGFCRIRPVHVAGLVKRYRQLLGEKRHLEIHYPGDSPRITMLTSSIASLADAIAVCEPESNLSVLRPIPFRFPAPLPGMALTRAILFVLRDTKDGLTAELLVASITERHKLAFCETGAEYRFTSRITCLLNNLANRGVIQHSDDHWSV